MVALSVQNGNLPHRYLLAIDWAPYSIFPKYRRRRVTDRLCFLGDHSGRSWTIVGLRQLCGISQRVTDDSNIVKTHQF